MLRIILALFVSLLAFSCGGPRYVDYFPCHDDGRCKPSVVVVPVLIPCEIPCGNELSNAMTGNMRFQMMNNGELFLFSPGEVHQGVAQIGDIDWLSSNELFAKTFCDADFILLTELIQCPCAPHCSVGPCPCQYNFYVKLRIKVIDVRPRCPRIVLQEIMTGDYIVPCTAEEASCGILNWSPDCYKNSPLGRAHQRLITHMVHRVEEVIKCAY